MNQQAKDWITSVHSLYGPYAFGVISLLMIWFLIVKPELERNKADWDNILRVTTQLHQTQIISNETSETLRETALLLKELRDTSP